MLAVSINSSLIPEKHTLSSWSSLWDASRAAKWLATSGRATSACCKWSTQRGQCCCWTLLNSYCHLFIVTSNSSSSTDFYFYIFSICQCHHDEQGSSQGVFISWMSVRLRGWDKSVGRALEQNARCSADMGVIPRCGNSGMEFFSKSQLNCRFSYS